MARVMVADDEKKTRERVVSFLKKAGFEVVPVADTRVVIESHRANPADVVILDMRWNRRGLPKSLSDGILTSQEIRAFDQCVVILSLTAYRDHYEPLDTSKAVDFWFEKQFLTSEGMEELLQLIRGAVATVQGRYLDMWQAEATAAAQNLTPSDVIAVVNTVRRLVSSLPRVDCDVLDRIVEITRITGLMSMVNAFAGEDDIRARLMDLLARTADEPRSLVEPMYESGVGRLFADYEADLRLFQRLRGKH